uniref:Uncharacterized protein n=1 Tax=Anopheles minimus TaxID=112268 RepID=A0A182VX83_9DIPT
MPVGIRSVVPVCGGRSTHAIEPERTRTVWCASWFNALQGFLGNMLAIIVSGVALLLSIAIWWTVANYGSALRYAGKLGGPVAYPLVGNGLIFINKTPAEFLQVLGKLIAQYGKCLRVWLGTQLIVLITDPKDIEELLSSPKYIDKSSEYDFIRPWLGEGLLTSRGRKWQTHRKTITPTFHFKILEQFVEIFDQQSNTFVDILRLFAKSGETFDVFPLVTLCALDVICESAMGTKVNAQMNSESEYVKAVKEITNLIQVRMYDFVIRYEFFFRFSANRRRQRKALAILHGYTDSVIRARRQELNETLATGKATEHATDESEDPVGMKKRMAFLDMLLQATIDGRPLTDLEIREEVDTFMFEGHDTTTSAISFILLSLAKNPDIQEKVFNEVRNIVGDDRKQPITLTMLNDMRYLDLVIKETLRLYPSVPMFGRKMLQNTEINGKVFPAGSNVIIFPFFLGRNPDYFPNPEKFDPERFNVESSAEKTNPYQYIPFSAGPRNCIGQKFAVTELKSVVSKVLRNFEILPSEHPHEETFIAELILRPEQFLRIIAAILKEYGDCVRVWLGTQLAIVVLDPKDIEVLLSSPKYIDKSTEYDFIRPWLGEGLLTSRGRKWHTHRKVLTPTFHFKILEQFVEIFDRQSTTFVKVLEPLAESGKSFDIFPQVTLCALDVICESAMGTKVNAQINSTSDYVLAVKEITNLIQLRFYDFLIRYDIFFRLSANSRKQKKVLKVLHDYTDSVIKGRRQQLEAATRNEEMEEASDQDLGIKKRKAFLDMLLQSTVDGRPLTDLEIREEVDTFMFEGHDTTTSAISFLLQSLAKNPDVQQKVFEEVRTIVGDDRTRTVTMAMLNDMSYLDLVIKETLRLYPSVPMIGRKMLQTTEINGKIFPAGANLIIMPFFLGRDARYFPDPERFDPERFNVERSAEKANPYQYIPFSAGPRNCIGQKFAVAELKSIVSKVLRHYEILPPAEKQDESFIAELILRPEHGVRYVSFGKFGASQTFLAMFVAMFTFLALAISVALYVYVEKFSKILKHSGKLGGPTAYPLIGNGLLFAGQTPAGFMQTVGRLIQQYGRCFRIWLGTQMLIVITEPKDIEVLLSSNKYIDKSIEYDFVRPWLGDGLLTSTGRKWHTRRKVITPTFHFKILEQFVEIFDQQSNTFVQVLGTHAKTGNTFDIFRPVTLCALDVICETAMGTKVNAQLNTESTYVQAVKEITNLVQIRLFNFLIRYELFYRFSSNRRKQLEALKVLHGYTDSVIKNRRRELEAGNTNALDHNENDLGIKKKMAFLDMLLQSKVDGQPLTDLEIREEVDTFMFEGHDTTTSAISFLMQNLAKHPEIQQKVFEEVRNIIGDDRTRPATIAMLNDMHYLDLVIKETLRLFPSVPMFGRKIMEDAEINGKVFPAGSNAIILPLFLGRNPEFFPNPEKFDPERFNVETSAEKTNPYQYVPFSAGPRNCIGQKFAVAEIKSLILLALLVVILTINYLLVRQNLKYGKNIPGPLPLPVVGCFYLYINLKPEDIIDFVSDLRNKYGNLFRVWIGNRLALFCTNVKFNETVLSSQKQIRKSELYKFLIPWLGDGLLLSTGQKWFNKRKILTPAFHFKILDQFIEVFHKQSNILAERLRPEANGSLVNIYPCVTLAALDIICETAMGTSINAQTDADSAYVKAITELSLVLTGRFVKVWQRVDFLFNLSADKRRQDRIIKVLHDFTTKIIQSRRRELMEQGGGVIGGTVDDEDMADIGTKRRMAFLDVLLQATIDGRPLTDKEIQEEVDTFMFEGHDTTTIAISFTLLLLARHPEVQEKAFQEIVDIVGNDPTTPVSHRNLQDMKYLEMVIKESLRLYPPVPIIARRFTENVELGEKIVPEGSNFNIGIMHMHRDPTLFPNPERFDPERFAPDRTMEQSSPYAYVPFSAGPRNCIGQKFAMLELKSTVSKVIRNFKLTSAGPEPKLTMQLTLKPRDGLYIGFVPRAR